MTQSKWAAWCRPAEVRPVGAALQLDQRPVWGL